MIHPIQPTYRTVNPPHKPRAIISIGRGKLTVIDTVTNEKFTLEPEKAWEKYYEINV